MSTSEPRDGILDRPGIGLDEQHIVQRHEPVLQRERRLEVTLEAGVLEFRAQSRRHVRRRPKCSRCRREP